MVAIKADKKGQEEGLSQINMRRPSSNMVLNGSKLKPVKAIHVIASIKGIANQVKDWR